MKIKISSDELRDLMKSDALVQKRDMLNRMSNDLAKLEQNNLTITFDDIYRLIDDYRCQRRM